MVRVISDIDRREYDRDIRRDAEPRNWARQTVLVIVLAAMIWFSCSAVVWVLG